MIDIMFMIPSPSQEDEVSVVAMMLGEIGHVVQALQEWTLHFDHQHSQCVAVE